MEGLDKTITVSILFAIAVAAQSCATTDGSSPNESYLEVLNFRTVPDGSPELKDECACLNVDIARINQFTDKMKHSDYSVFYLALGREKVGELQSRADMIGCKIER